MICNFSILYLFYFISYWIWETVERIRMWGENITEINITDIDASNRIRNKIQQTWLVNNDKFSQHFYKLCGVAEININWLGSRGEVSFNIVKLHTKLVAREPLLLRWWRLRPPTCSLATVGTPSTRWSAGRNIPPLSWWSCTPAMITAAHSEYFAAYLAR